VELELFTQIMKQENSSVICGWETCPESVKKKIEDILAFFRRTMGNGLTGFYLHGSIAMNCFNPNTSDIDFLAVTSRKLTVPEKKAIITFLQGIDTGLASPEMSIVTAESLKNLVYPSPFELHYSHATRNVYTGGQVSWEEPRFDTDLPAHFMAIRERGICLYGEPVKKVFSEVPQEMFMASIVQDLHWIRQEIKSLPFIHIVLNPCRALAYVNEGKFMSKQEGGHWALRQLPQLYSGLIEKALNAYSGAEDVVPPSLDTLIEFIDYAIREFIYLASKTDAENLFFKRSY
jgi:hypothetical protein